MAPKSAADVSAGLGRRSRRAPRERRSRRLRVETAVRPREDEGRAHPARLMRRSRALSTPAWDPRRRTTPPSRVASAPTVGPSPSRAPARTSSSSWARCGRPRGAGRAPATARSPASGRAKFGRSRSGAQAPSGTSAAAVRRRDDRLARQFVRPLVERHTLVARHVDEPRAARLDGALRAARRAPD